MIELKGFYTRLYVEVDRHNKTLEQQVMIALKGAARAWLQAVILKVPVWTGTSQGSLKPLGAFLRSKIDIQPLVTRPNMGPEVGARQSKFQFVKEGNKYIFRFEENVPHYTINEYYNANLSGLHLKNPGPYQSFKAGDAAWQAHINEDLPKRLPKVANFVVQRRTRKVGD